MTAPGFVPRSSGVNRVLSEVPIPDDRVMSRRRRGAVRTVRCTTCSSRRCSRGRLHVRTHQPRIRCRMTASVHICTARRRTPGGEAFAAGHRSRGICSCRWVFDWAATCNPLNRAFPDHTPCRSPCRAESHGAPTQKGNRGLHPQRLGNPMPRRMAGGTSPKLHTPTASHCTVTAGIGTAHAISGGP